ncbi:Clp protease ClpP [Ralstonia solanacearum]|uniref:head maturation protease, ClpP-related n=1 Tax=Ralstonia solanacearum TaxID=305 RepID=UPI0001816990|nr:head maturation protease, ClpP-related [Ralstonia solanacearum]MDC6179024.1 Clp protease ClpP [Ralstonia solanacearum]MDC6211511.1 Clp protease ClpP [Ralstonia solanacearum]MDC6240254.1 Clp protease ClpP [Ralstonia solanacearum]MDD7802051.1 Clp protease ClpP [Ralstonia solanacearum]TYZ55350.1 Clp protease ClpP [Ralstonia solanacearum]
MRRNKILQLLSDNRAAARVFNVVASADSEVTVYLYDYIVSDDWWGGVSATTFVKELAGITADVIRLRVNSPGGDVFAARAMEAALRGHSAKIIVHVDGLAASAASFLIMAADEIEIADGAFIMIHKAWTALWGNADDLRAEAELLDKIDSTLVNTYAQRTGQSADDIATWMAAETWLGADDAVERGFADRKADASAQPSAKASAWNLRAYSNAPKPASATPTVPAAPAVEPQSPAGNLLPDFAAMRRRLDLCQRL